jgi:hypothetical protein
VPDPNDRRRLVIYPGPQNTETLAGLYDPYMDSLTTLLDGYSDSELILITQFIDGLTKINQAQVR